MPRRADEWIEFEGHGWQVRSLRPPRLPWVAMITAALLLVAYLALIVVSAVPRPRPRPPVRVEVRSAPPAPPVQPALPPPPSSR